MRAVCFGIFLTLFSAALFAAEPTGTIAGTVVDPSGAAVVTAKVTVTNVNTGLTRDALTGADGGYVFPLIPAGTYNVSVEAPGFRRFEQQGITVRTDQSSTVPVSLQIGATTESVTVQANAEMVETRSGALGQVVTQQKIVELPLNGRNAASLILLSPGTADLNADNARGSGDTIQTASYPGSQSIATNGARADTVNYNLDGGSNQDHYTNVNNPFPNPDALEEFSVQTNSYSAEFGRGAGAVVNVVTKSGTNSLHGTGFDFLRNGAMNSRNFFADRHDDLKRNQFGGSLGGPVVKDKLFFFGTYQGTILRNISTGNSATALTPAQRAGDFSGLSRQLVNPFTRQPFPNNQVPASAMSPAALKILALLPVPSTPDGIIRFDRPVDDTENQFMGRVDYNLSKQRIYGRYFYSRYKRDPVIGNVNIIASFRGFDLFDQGVSVSDTYNVRPNLLNNFIFSYNRNNGEIISGAPFSLPDIGVPIAASNPPEIALTVSGYFSINSGHPGHFNRSNFHFTDAVHWIRGPHEIAVGGDFMRMGVDLINTYRQNGNIRFRSTAYSGDPRVDFLTGYIERFIQGGGEYAGRRGNLGSMFVQDNWKATRNLVLNLGLRWDPFVPYYDTLGRTECFLPGQKSTRFPNAPAGYLYAGDPGCPDGGFQSSWLQFAPRLGFAYSAGSSGHTVVRGGWGMFYQPPFVEAFNNMVDSAPFSPQVFRFRVPLSNPYLGATENPFPSQFAPRIPGADVGFDLPLDLAVSYEHKWKPSRVMNWNFTVEHQLRSDLLIRAGYVGSKGTHLGYNTDVNAPLPSATATVDNEDDRRPFQQFHQVTQDVSGANSIYNGLQIGVEKRFSHGLSLGANYTWSRSIDWVSYLTDLDGINVLNPYNVRAYRGVSEYNIPHRFVLNYYWQLPSPAGGIARSLLGGWATTAIWNWQSGFPLNIAAGEDTSFSLPENGNDQADVLSKPGYTSGSRAQRIQQWFTTSAFGVPKPNNFGNAGRNILVGPGTFNLDASLHKTFTITERWRLQYRVEAFNALNHTQLDNPDTTVEDSNFGRITGARSPRILQMALKVIF